MLQHSDHKATLSRVRLGEQVADLLLAAIRLHEFLPGEQLPSERELCARLAVNRTAVREGLRWLEQQQFIEVRRGKYGGAFVLHRPADLALERLRGKIPDLRQLLEYRAVVEPVAAAIAADRIEESKLARLQALHQREQGELGLTRALLRLMSRSTRSSPPPPRTSTSSRPSAISGCSWRQVLTCSAELSPGAVSRKPAMRSSSTRSNGHDVQAAAAVMERHVVATRRAIAASLAEKGIDRGRRGRCARPVSG